MITRIGLNGFGRIGRLILRASFNELLIERSQVMAINDPYLTSDKLLYLLKYDSIHGRFHEKELEQVEGGIKIKGHFIKVFQESDPSKVKWGDFGAEYICENSGEYLTQERCQLHLNSGAKKVIISTTPKDKETPIIVMGVNNNIYDSKKMPIVSNASCTTNCVAPLAKVLNDNFGIEEALITTVHAQTINQPTVDGPSKGQKNWRIGRAAGCNIIPATTGAATAVGKVIPDLDGKITGMAFRVPVGDVSVVDLTARLKNPTTYQNLCDKMMEASQQQLKGILRYTDEQLVSSDFINDPHSVIFDSTASIQLNEKFVKIVGWYDNEFGYACRMLDLANYMQEQDSKL